MILEVGFSSYYASSGFKELKAKTYFAHVDVRCAVVYSS